MSTKESSHIEALKAVARALDDLADAKYAVAESFSLDRMSYEDYDARNHRTAVDEHAGVCQSALLVYTMIDEARRSAA